MNLSGTAQVAACDTAVKSQACSYIHNVQERSEQLAGISDIEDLVKVGRSRRVRYSQHTICTPNLSVKSRGPA